MIERHGLVLGPGVRDRFAWSKQVSDAQVEESVAIRDEVTTALAAMLGSDGVMVLPTMPDIARCSAPTKPGWRTTATTPSSCCAWRG